MRNEETDLAALYDMYVAARDIQSFVAGMSLNQFSGSKVTRLAVERAIEIIAEGIRRLREEFKHEHPEILWQNIIRQRNMIAHEYDKVQVEKIWLVATEAIPILLATLEPLIPLEYR